MRRITWTAVLLGVLGGCGGEAPAADAGSDAGLEARPDAGTDAGPPPPTGCHLWTGDGGPPPGDPGPLPAPADFPPATGPGAPAQTYPASALGEHCAYLPVGATDEGHHNTGFFLDGYLVRPWAHERGRGGIAVWDFDDPCNPELVANPLDEQIRETHATGLSNIGGRFIAVASLTGVQFWDVGDVTAPLLVNDFPLEGVTYPDAYMFTVMSTFWQAPYLFVGASGNGVYVVDASDPRDPVVVAQYQSTPPFVVGQVVVIGNHLFAFSSEGSVAEIVDVRDPTQPRPFPNGRYTVTNGETDRLGRPMPLPAYFGHVSGGYSYHPRIALGGGLAIFDVTDPTNPTLAGDYAVTDGDGGYVFLKEGLAFVGLSDYGAIVDVTDPSAPVRVRRLELTGDVDTLTPFGNVVVVSVDDDAVEGQASAVVPYQEEVDATPPSVNMIVPADGSTSQALTSRVGMTFTEFVAMESVWRGSVFLRERDTGRVIETHLSGQEGVVSVSPVAPLAPETTYELVVPAGGVTDLNGNPTASPFSSTFTTTRCGG